MKTLKGWPSAVIADIKATASRTLNLPWAGKSCVGRSLAPWNDDETAGAHRIYLLYETHSNKNAIEVQSMLCLYLCMGARKITKTLTGRQFVYLALWKSRR